MGIAFKTLDEQVDILVARGITIKNKNIVKKLLMRSNYYDIVNGYGKFLQPVPNQFYEGVTFEELYAIYLYDREIKSLFFQNIVKAEAALRSCIAYIFSEKYRKKFSYLNTNNFRNNEIDVVNLLSKIASIIIHESKHDNAIRHYKDKYQEVPLWVLVNFLPFGLLEKFFKLMKDSDRNDIAKSIGQSMIEEYGRHIVLLPEQLDSYIKNIRFVRNVAAHDDRLITYSCPTNIKHNEDLFSYYGMQKNDPKQSIYHVYITLSIFLLKDEFYNFTNELRVKTGNLEKILVKSSSPITSFNILSSMGFTKNQLK